MRFKKRKRNSPSLEKQFEAMLALNQQKFLILKLLNVFSITKILIERLTKLIIQNQKKK